MGSYVNGVWVPNLADTGWDDEINDLLQALGRSRIDVTLAPYGADPTGGADATAAFNAAAADAGPGGVIYGSGDFQLADWAPSQQVTFQGSGMPDPQGGGGTRLIARPGATWVAKLGTHYGPSIQDCFIDGNNRASSGVLIGGGSGSSQDAYLKRVQLTRCDTALKIDTTTSTQNDANTLDLVRVDESNTGLWLNTPNSQFTQVRQVKIGADLGVRMSGGGLTWLGGGISNGSASGAWTGILFDGASIEQLVLIDWISESALEYVDIDGTNYWPELGVTAINCQFQGHLGSSPTSVVQGVFGRFLARHCGFVSPVRALAASNATFIDEFCIFDREDTGADQWVPEVASNATRFSSLPRDTHAADHQIRRWGGADGATLLYEADAFGNLFSSGTVQGAQFVQAGDATHDGRVYFGDDPNGVYLLKTGSTILTASPILVSRATPSTDIAFEGIKTGESVAWWSVNANGTNNAGPGGGSGADTAWGRVAANTFGLGANDALATGKSAHGSLPSAAGYAAGAQFFCTTDKQPLWSDGTNWVEADGTNH